MDEITDYQIADAMKAIGGSFVRLVGQAWFAADLINREKLKAAFPEYWEEYRELVQLKARG